jgi:hypothetical protein
MVSYSATKPCAARSTRFCDGIGAGSDRLHDTEGPRELRRRCLELQALEAAIASLVTACVTTCDGGAAPDCVILRS